MPKRETVEAFVAMVESNQHDLAIGKGVLFLAELRKTLGAEKFDKMMDEFGRTNAGKPVTTEQFVEAVERTYGRPLGLAFDGIVEPADQN